MRKRGNEWDEGPWDTSKTAKDFVLQPPDSEFGLRYLEEPN